MACLYAIANKTFFEHDIVITAEVVAKVKLGSEDLKNIIPEKYF